MLMVRDRHTRQPIACGWPALNRCPRPPFEQVTQDLGKKQSRGSLGSIWTCRRRYGWLAGTAMNECRPCPAVLVRLACVRDRVVACSLLHCVQNVRRVCDRQSV